MTLFDTDSPGSTPEGFEVVVVCTANVCRSPAMAAILEAGIAQLDGPGSERIRVRSAGISATVGQSMDHRTAEALRRVGVGPGEGGAVQVTPQMIEEADLVLTASRRHRTAVVRMSPQTLPRTFTIREFARLCADGEARFDAAGDDPVARLRAAVAYAGERRGFSLPAKPENDDVIDPIGRSASTHRKVVELLQDAAAAVLHAAEATPRKVPQAPVVTDVALDPDPVVSAKSAS